MEREQGGRFINIMIITIINITTIIATIIIIAFIRSNAGRSGPKPS